MIINKTKFEGLYVLEPVIFEDKRGSFFESYNKETLEKKGLLFNFIQDNEVKSIQGALRGLHFQKEPFSQTKLIRAVKGSVQDVVVDLRKNSATFGESFKIELSEINKLQLLIPKGFAHGYLVLSKESVVSYKVDEIYNPNFEMGIIWSDETLKIDWEIEKVDIIVSEKDEKLFTFKEIKELLK